MKDSIKRAQSKLVCFAERENFRLKGKKLFYLMTAVALMSGLTACDNQDELTASGASNGSVLTMNGNCDIYTLQNSENADWTITSCPDWVTPVQTSGSATSDIQLYVESNGLAPLRQGNIVVEYANGKKRITRAEQNNNQSGWSIQRSYAVGWSFDVRTYDDSRGLRQQIFNTQKMKAQNPNIYVSEPSTNTNFQFFYGENVSDLQKNMSGKLNLETDSVKYNTFNLSLEGNFGKTVLSNSKRIFSWIRQVYHQQRIYLTNFDEEDAQESGWFTADFQAMRKEVIDQKGSDAAVSRLIEMYGTHFIVHAVLGGCYDYYYSTVLETSMDSLEIDGALKFGFQKKFNLDISGNAKYENTFTSMKTETIEKFSVRGGDAMALARTVEDGTIDNTAVETWRKSIEDEKKFELMEYELLPISALFSDEIGMKINDYMYRMYYNEQPLTRTIKK